MKTKNKKQTSNGKDKTTYKMDDMFYPTKSGIAHAIISVIAKKYSWQQINQMFEDAGAYKESYSLCAPVHTAKEKSKKYTRYFLHPENILKDKQGVRFAVSNSFSIWNIEQFLKFSKSKFNLKINKVK